jgi:DoxX-like family
VNFWNLKTMTNKAIHNLITFCISAVWIVNGLFCKVLNFVPRHQQIVSRILGVQHSRILTILIGCSEIFMAIWILSKIKKRLNAIAQMAVVAIMNILEFILVPDLLLWGKLNAAFAFLFILVVYINEFYFNKKIVIES